MKKTDATKVHQRYRTKAGKIVPGVTTVLGLLAKPALIHWAWKLGLEGQDYKKVRDQAAGIGTVTHYLVECSIKHLTPDLGDYSPNVVEAAELAFSGFEDWRSRQNLVTEGSEVGLVSEDWEYGGMMDWVAYDPTKDWRWLFDIKTSKGIFDEMRYQLAAYLHMWNENYPDRPIDKVAILLLNKVDGSFSFNQLGNLDTEFEIFKHMRSVYALRKAADPNRGDNRGLRRKRGPAK